jgi:hypothetical protein
VGQREILGETESVRVWEGGLEVVPEMLETLVGAAREGHGTQTCEVTAVCWVVLSGARIGEGLSLRSGSGIQSVCRNIILEELIFGIVAIIVIANTIAYGLKSFCLLSIFPY